MIPPPFVPNSPDDMHCVTAVYRMLYKYYFDEEYTWEEIDHIAKAVPGKGTWTLVLDTALAKRGVDLVNIEAVNYQTLFTRGPQYLRELYGEKTAEYYLTRSNIANVISDIPEFLAHVHHIERRSSTDEIVHHLNEGKLVSADINSSILNNTAGFSLHFVLAYALDGKYLILHDPGLPPQPARKVLIEDFKKCFEYPGGGWSIHTYERKG